MCTKNLSITFDQPWYYLIYNFTVKQSSHLLGSSYSPLVHAPNLAISGQKLILLTGRIIYVFASLKKFQILTSEIICLENEKIMNSNKNYGTHIWRRGVGHIVSNKKSPNGHGLRFTLVRYTFRVRQRSTNKSRTRQLFFTDCGGSYWVQTWKENLNFQRYFNIFKRITTILTPSTSEGDEWWEVTFFVLKVLDHKSAMLMYEGCFKSKVKPRLHLWFRMWLSRDSRAICDGDVIVLRFGVRTTFEIYGESRLLRQSLGVFGCTRRIFWSCKQTKSTSTILEHLWLCSEDFWIM